MDKRIYLTNFRGVERSDELEVINLLFLLPYVRVATFVRVITYVRVATYVRVTTFDLTHDFAVAHLYPVYPLVGTLG